MVPDCWCHTHLKRLSGIDPAPSGFRGRRTHLSSAACAGLLLGILPNRFIFFKPRLEFVLFNEVANYLAMNTTMLRFANGVLSPR